MIIKGGSRAGPEQLARHLQRTDTNERVEILEAQWTTQDLQETFRDWQTLSEGTRGKKGLYHVNIDPAEDYTMTRAQWQRCVEVLEKELGFDGQPRVVVMHEKYGREHIHVVWSRTDTETMTLRSDSMNYLAHERASQALELEFGHELVPGKHAKRDRAQQPEFPRQEMTHAEWQQYERTGIHPADRKEQITELRQASDGAAAFRSALEEQGYILARGARSSFVVIDETGGVHSLNRQLPGMSADEFREFMQAIDPASLPTVKQAKLMLVRELEAKDLQERAERAALERESRSAQNEQAFRLSEKEIDALKQALAERQGIEMANIAARQDADVQRTGRILNEDNAAKLDHLARIQEAERLRFQRDNAPPAGVDRVIDVFQRWWNPQEARERDADLERRRQEIEERQQKERAGQEATLAKSREVTLSELAERHAQERREYAVATGQDLERYIKQEEDARRLRADIEQRQHTLEQARARAGLRETMTDVEWRQFERTNVHPEQRRQEITALFNAADGAPAFRASLEEQGYVLAKGDKRGFVIVDESGEAYSLSRQIRAMKEGTLLEFMKDVDKDQLPSVKEARETQKERRSERRERELQQKLEAVKKLELTPEEIDAIRTSLAERQAQDGQPFTEKDVERHVKQQEDARRAQLRKTMTDAEWRQFERTNVHPEQRRQEITNLFKAADEARALIASLQEQGYVLAKGDRRGFVIVDESGEAYSLSRQIHGMREATLREFMKDVDQHELPSVKDARDIQKERRKELRVLEQQKREAAAARKFDLTPEEVDAIRRSLAERQARDGHAFTEKDVERYVKQEETARRLRAEREEEQKRLEEERARAHNRDGPDPPDRAR